MGNDLNGGSQIISPPFFLQDFTVNFTRRHIGILIEADINKALIVSQIQVCFRSIIGHINFSVLIRAHGPWIDIDIRVKFLNSDLETTILEQPAQTGCYNPLANG